MGKASASNANNMTTKTAISPEKPLPVAEPAFSNGELGQLQEILYGAQQRTTNEQLLTLQNQVNEQIETLGNMLNSRINQLTESIDKAVKVQEQKLADLQSDGQTKADSMSSAIEQINSSVEQLQSKKLDSNNLAQLLGKVSEQLDSTDQAPSK